METKTKHTPGPWAIPGITWQSIRTTDGVRICRVETNENDSRLIAAAPELLAVLKKLEDIISGIEAEADNLGTDLSEARHWWKKAGDIIYKAEGGN